MSKQLIKTIETISTGLLVVTLIFGIVGCNDETGDPETTGSSTSRSNHDPEGIEPALQEQGQSTKPVLNNPENPDRIVDRWPILVEAAYRGDQEEVVRLLDLGADIKRTGPEGWTALMQAAGNNHLGLTNLLLDRGASINAENSAQKNAYDLAAERGYDAVAKRLLEKGAADDSVRRFITHAYFSEMRLADEMLEEGFNMNRTDYVGRSALFYTLSKRHVERYANYAFKPNQRMVKFLLENGADPDLRDDAGKTPLIAHLTEYGNVQELVTLLLEYDSDIKATDHQDRTILFHFLEPSNFQKAISLGADVNHADEQGNTPLHHWCKMMSSGMVQQLIVNGADLSSINQSGKTPLDLFPKKNPGGREAENWIKTKAIIDTLPEN